MDKTLYNKLKLEKYQNIVLFSPAKEKNVLDELRLPTELQSITNLVIAFVYSLEEISKILMKLSKNEHIIQDTVVYLAYPKTSNKLGHNAIHRDTIMPYLGVDDTVGLVPGTDFKFNMMVKLDENYTIIGLKNFKGKEVRQSTAPSQKVSDYIKYIPEIQNRLKEYPERLDHFNGLTPGRQRQWARHIYSARKEETREKRFRELVEGAE